MGWSYMDVECVSVVRLSTRGARWWNLAKESTWDPDANVFRRHCYADKLWRTAHQHKQAWIRTALLRMVQRLEPVSPSDFLILMFHMHGPPPPPFENNWSLLVALWPHAVQHHKSFHSAQFCEMLFYGFTSIKHSNHTLRVSDVSPLIPWASWPRYLSATAAN